MSRLRHSSDREPGISRHRAGKGFRYRDANGRLIRDHRELRRIAALSVPPAYRDVWICPDPDAHLQATGRDARGRKQYRYHPHWRQQRDRLKFRRMAEFADALPRLRRKIDADLRAEGLPRSKVLALVAALLDTTQARVGNVEYARDNHSFGLTTLRHRHVKFIRDGRLHLSFVGKGGTEHDLVVDDRRLSRIVRRCRELPGQALFQYVDDDGHRHGIDSGQVNTYLHDAMGEDFTAKDFRTWGASVQAAALLAGTSAPARNHARACTTRINKVIKSVAETLCNTPAVCRKSYINPLVFELWRSGDLQRLPTSPAGRITRRIEQAVARLLRRHGKAATRR